MKTCCECNETKPEELFYRNRSRKDGLTVRCIECSKKYNREYFGSPHGKAIVAWNNISGRATNSNGDNPSYADVELRMDRDEFIKWFVPEMEKWMAENPGIRGSVDRIRDEGHYEIGNLRIISMVANARKSMARKNVHAPDGMAWCSMCKAYLTVVSFHKNRSEFNGLQGRCKECNKNAIKSVTTCR
jgi:hypothetical protein